MYYLTLIFYIQTQIESINKNVFKKLI